MVILDSSIGPIVAATVAGAISLISLIISKENKTSEFRQQWIDSLRSELATYITHVMEIYRYRSFGRDFSDSDCNSISESYQKANESITKIRLRLNPTEKLPKNVLSLLQKYELLFSSNEIPEESQFHQINHDFVEAAQLMLKAEWCRVRSGEIIFQIIRGTSFAVLFAGLFIIFNYL